MKREAKETIERLNKLILQMHEGQRPPVEGAEHVNIIYLNIQVQIKPFIETFIMNKGIKYILLLIHQSQRAAQLDKKPEYISKCLLMLQSLFGFQSKITEIQQRQSFYFQRLFELTNLNLEEKKQVI